MAADLYRVVRTLTSVHGDQTLASDPISRDVAIARFNKMVAWRLDKVRVLREQDFQAGQAAL